MSDLLVLPSKILTGGADIDSLFGSDDWHDSHHSHRRQSDEWLLAESHRQDAPLGGPRTFKDERWTAVFAGDLVDHNTVPFDQVLAALDEGHQEFLAGLAGIFAIAAYDNRSKRLFAVSDHRSQKPYFYRFDGASVRISTSLAVFARLADGLEFNKQWLWQSLYFNFPVDDTTFLKNVKRIPPASVLVFDGQSRKISIRSYAGGFKQRSPLLKGQEALQAARDVFAMRVPAYYRGSQDNVACALTAGWDGRTVLALAPADEAVTAYTYGVPGCGDLKDAASTAAAVGIDHLEIPFDGTFASKLPHHALETVYLSAGLLGVLRSTLHCMYDALTEGGRRFPLTLSGISLGTQIRGHAQYPDLISQELALRFQGRSPAYSKGHWQAILGNDAKEFMAFISSKLESLKERFGPFDSSGHHLSYTVFPLSTHHFCGELAIADRYTTVRVPAWDSAVIELLYSIEFSMLSFSQFVSRQERAHRKEMVLQAHLFKELAPDFYRVAVHGIHPSTILAGELPYQAVRAYRAVQRRLAQRLWSHAPAPLENWTVWLFDQNREFVVGLLRSGDTLINEFVEPSMIENVITTRNMRMVGKLLTAEIILRLIKSRWQRFW